MPNRRLWTIGCLGLIIAVGIILLVGAKSGSLVDMYQVAESDGHRQLEFKILGLIPYERQVDAPDVHVSEDYWREMTKSGITLRPDVEAAFRNESAIRIVRENEVEYWCRADVKTDHRKLVADLAKQLGSATPYTSTWTAGGRMSPPKGPVYKVLADLRTKGSIPSEDICDVGIGITMPK